MGMKAYSTDLRERAIESVESGECNIPQAARRYKVSEPSLERWLAKYRKTGSCAPRPHAGGPARKLATAEAAIRAAVKAQPDATLEELCKIVEKETYLRRPGARETIQRDVWKGALKAARKTELRYG